VLEQPSLTEIDATSAYAPDGVDLTLIRWMLSLTPDERLDALQGFVDALWELKGGDAEIGFPIDPSSAG
jgi:hypothetical protein